jgi:hypothetical protein
LKHGTVYTSDNESAQYHYRIMLTVPIVMYGVFGHRYLLYRQRRGAAPKTMLLTVLPLLVAVAVWTVLSEELFLFPS